MGTLLGTLIVTLLAALLIWLVARFYWRSRLYCAPSRLYEYSNLIDGSSTAQIVIANRGRKTEESIDLQLSPDYSYHLLAATQSGIEISPDKAIRIAALLPKSEVNLVFVAEGKPRFSKDGIRYIRSKTSSGTIASSLAEGEATSPAVLLPIGIFVLLVGLIGYGFGKTIGEDLWQWGKVQVLTSNAHPFTEGCMTTFSNAKDEPDEDELSKDALEAFAARTVNVTNVATLGDRLLVDVEINNALEGPIEYSLELISHAADSTTNRHILDSRVYDITLMHEGEKRAYTLSAHFPHDRLPKQFWLETRVELFSYWAEVKRSFFFGADASMTCSASS